MKSVVQVKALTEHQHLSLSSRQGYNRDSILANPASEGELKRLLVFQPMLPRIKTFSFA